MSTLKKKAKSVFMVGLILVSMGMITQATAASTADCDHKCFFTLCLSSGTNCFPCPPKATL